MMPPRIHDIQVATCTHYGISLEDMLSRSKLREHSRPRQVAMYLARQSGERSYPQIGRQFKRDHSTVMHAVDLVERVSAGNPELSDDLTAIRRRLEDRA